MSRLRIKRGFPAILFTVSLCALTLLAQSEKPLSKDEVEAGRVARAFARDMQRTKDLRPLWRKYGTPNYGLLNPQTESLEKAFMTPAFSSKVIPRLVRRLHVSVFNWFYLESIWRLHQADDEVELPPDVARIFKADPILSQMVGIDDKPDDEKLIASEGELISMIRRLDRAAALYRIYLRRFPRIRTKTYLTNLAELKNERNYLYKPEKRTCDEDGGCFFGVPKHAMYVEVAIEPQYIVVLLKSAGRMKCIFCLIWTKRTLRHPIHFQASSHFE